MNDQFLKDYHQPPRRAFADTLHRHLNTLEKKPVLTLTRNRLRPFTFAILALMAALSLALLVSPSARALTKDFLQSVGGMLFTETGNYPGRPESEVTTVPSDTMSLAAAREILPFGIALPEWLPEGYTLTDEIRVTRFTEPGTVFAEIAFKNDEAGSGFGLNIQYREDSQAWQQIIGLDSIEEVQINGQPAALVRGIWNYDTKQWDNPEHISLFWQHHDVTYELSTIETALSVDQLIRIAESIP
jgi:hypothetical protein